MLIIKIKIKSQPDSFRQFMLQFVYSLIRNSATADEKNIRTIAWVLLQLDSNPNSSTVDHDVPIAVRTEVKACKEHPISNFISYDSLSPSYKIERMYTLIQNGRQQWLRRWELWQKLRHEILLILFWERNQLDVNGCSQ